MRAYILLICQTFCYPENAIFQTQKIFSIIFELQIKHLQQN